MLCSVDGCGRKASYKAVQLCQKHYFRVRRGGTTQLRRKARPRYVRDDGYVMVYDPDHPLMSHCGYVFEHRKVAYDERGGDIDKCERCEMISLTWETCHIDHDDEVRDNNAPKNLFVTCTGCNTMRGGAARPTSVLLSAIGETKSVAAWSRDPRVRVSRTTIRRRLRRGASHNEALFGPKGTHKNTTPKYRPIKFENGRRVRA